MMASRTGSGSSSSGKRVTRSNSTAATTTTSSSVRMMQDPLKLIKKKTSSTEKMTTEDGNEPRSSKRGGGGSGAQMPPPTLPPPSQQKNMLLDLSVYSQTNENRSNDQKIFFVVGEGLDENSCSPNMKTVYKMSSEADIAIQWMSERECLDRDPVPGNFFVMDPFEGPAFKKLQKVSHKQNKACVVGPQVLKHFLTAEPALSMDLTKDPPLATSMRNVLVCFSGIKSPERKEELMKKVRLLMGIVSNTLTKGVTHLVTDNVLMDKVPAAHEFKIPVMTTGWIDAVFDDSLSEIIHGTDRKYVKFTCPIFHNLVVCVSQVQANTKTALKNVIEENGGQYSADLRRDVTNILIVPEPGGEKFKHANLWKMPCVTPEWVGASKEAGYAVKWQIFATARRNALPRGHPDSSHVQTSTPLGSMAMPLDNSANDSAISDGGFHPYSNRIRSVEVLTDIGIVEETLDVVINSSSQSHSSTEHNVPDVLQEIPKLMKRNKDPFLDGCKIYISAGLKDENVRKLVNASGAVRYNKLSEQVTHVITGLDNKVPDEELQKLKAMDILPNIVSVYWLLESAKTGTSASEDDFRIDIEQNTRKTSRGDSGSRKEKTRQPHNAALELNEEVAAAAAPDRNGSRGSGSGNRKAGSGSGSNNHSSKKPSDPRNRSNRSDPENNVHVEEPPILNLPQDSETQGSQLIPVFRELKFHVQVNRSSEKAQIVEAIEACGGILSENYDILILSPAYSATDLKNIKEGVSFRTKQWVNDCIENGEICDGQYYYKPLQKFPKMEKIFHSVVVAMSGYSNQEKEYIASLAQAMGAKFQDVFARKTTNAAVKTTHLICDNVENNKYIAAQKWGTPVVLAEWVLESFREQKLLDASSFHPSTKNTDSQDSQAAIILPQTPQTGSGRGKKLSNMPGSTQAPGPRAASTPKNGEGEAAFPVFKTPTSRPRKSVNSAKNNTPNPNGSYDSLLGSFEAPTTESFLEYAKNCKSLSSDDECFKEWLAQLDPSQRHNLDESSILEGLTREQSRMVKEALQPGVPITVRAASHIIQTPLITFKRAGTGMGSPLHHGIDIDIDQEIGAAVAAVSSRFRVAEGNKPGITAPQKRKSDDEEQSPVPTTSKELQMQNAKKIRMNPPESEKDNLVMNEGTRAGVEDNRRTSKSNSSSGSETDDEDKFEEAGVTTGPGRATGIGIGSDSSYSTTTNSPKDTSTCSSTTREINRPAPSIAKLQNILATAGDSDDEDDRSHRYSRGLRLRRNMMQVCSGDANVNEEEVPRVGWAADEPQVIQGGGGGAIPSSNSEREDSSSDTESDIEDEDGPPVGTTTVSESDFEIRRPQPEPPRRLTLDPPYVPKFILSGLADGDKARMTDKIGRIRGEVLTSAGFDPAAFAVVANNLARSEKILCSIASGKPILKSSYIEQSYKKGSFLPVTREFIWQVEDSRNNTEEEICRCSFNWFIRIRRDPSDRPFRDESFLLNSITGPKAGAFRRLIESGGGAVVEDMSSATAIIVQEPGDHAPRQGVPVKHFSYLNSRILSATEED